MDLRPNGVGVDPGDRIEQAMPPRQRQQHDVVGRGDQRARPRADGLEQRVGLGQVHHSRDADPSRRQTRSFDEDRRARHRVQVRGRLLRQQRAARRADQIADLTGERRRVAARHTEHLARPGGLHGGAGPRPEPTRLGISDDAGRLDPIRARHRVFRVQDVGPGGEEDLPVDGDASGCELRHASPAGREERAERSGDRDRQGDAEDRVHHPAGAASEDPPKPGDAQHRSASSDSSGITSSEANDV